MGLISQPGIAARPGFEQQGSSRQPQTRSCPIGRQTHMLLLPFSVIPGAHQNAISDWASPSPERVLAPAPLRLPARRPKEENAPEEVIESSRLGQTGASRKRYSDVIHAFFTCLIYGRCDRAAVPIPASAPSRIGPQPQNLTPCVFLPHLSLIIP
ncbi:hypothetical protein VUR80DRAFT_2077 [Thermomyces stellatus]